MTDEKKSTSPDDEYQFPQDEYTSSHEAKSETESSETAGDQTAPAQSRGPMIMALLDRLSQFKNKRIVIVLLIAVLLIIVFRIVNSVDTTPTLPAISQQPTAPVVQSVAPSNNGNMAGSLDSLRMHSSETETQLKALQSQLSDLQNNMSQSQAANDALQKSVAVLTQQVQSLSVELNNALAKIKSPVKGPHIVYHLRAILPDRAWITSNTGETISVTVGDHITQYGKVKSIDPTQGIVMTASGRKIEYGPNDY